MTMIKQTENDSLNKLMTVIVAVIVMSIIIIGATDIISYINNHI
jgi:preprotein translocase subunit SecE